MRRAILRIFIGFIMNFALDIETLGTKSNAVILSIGVTPWELSADNYDIDRWINESLFVKLKVSSQRELGRTVDQSTLEWWKKQNDLAIKTSVTPSGSDLAPAEAIETLRRYIAPRCDASTRVFIRGSLDQLCIDDLCDQLGTPPLFPYNAYRDFRTAIDIIYGSSNGYVEVDINAIPGYNWASLVSHNPVHDCVRDVAMLLCGKVV